MKHTYPKAFSSTSLPFRQGASAPVFKAASILKSNLTEPPKLQELAERVGTSHTSLNQAFRQFFGTTTFGYLRRLRLEEARRLMREQTSNVTEIAFSVGYESLPSFSRAFVAHFGLCPRNFLAELKAFRHTEHSSKANLQEQEHV